MYFVIRNEKYNTRLDIKKQIKANQPILNLKVINWKKEYRQFSILKLNTCQSTFKWISANSSIRLFKKRKTKFIIHH